MNRPIPDHGTTARYKGRKNLPGCRCKACTRAASRADTERRLARMAGTPRMADEILFQRTVRHVRGLAANDMSHAQIGRSAGISQTSISDLISGERKSILSENARKLLSVQVEDRTGSCMVSALGAMRRVRALYWMGHRSKTIADFTGLHEDTVLGIARGRWLRTTVARVRAVCEAYDTLVMQDGQSDQAHKFAVSNDWHGPLAWDDDTIDDPNAVPQTDAIPPVVSEGGKLAARYLAGEAVILSDQARKEVLAHRFEWSNQTIEEIATELGMSAAAAEQAWNRMKRQAAAEGRRLWRRVYVRRERDLTQNDMEEVA